MGVVIDKLQGVMLHDHPIRLVSSDPTSAKEGSLIINTTDSTMKVYYSEQWQDLHTLSAVFSVFLFENGDRMLYEDGNVMVKG